MSFRPRKNSRYLTAPLDVTPETARAVESLMSAELWPSERPSLSGLLRRLVTRGLRLPAVEADNRATLIRIRRANGQGNIKLVDDICVAGINGGDGG